MSASDGQTRSGFVSIIGLTNAGKSTLVNTLVGSKVSIVSRKVQTTRCRILGIVMQDQSQIALMDTPGIFNPKKTLDKAMVSAAWDTLSDADVIVHLVDASKKTALEDSAVIIERLPKSMPCFLVLNKTDKVKKPDLLALTAGFNQQFSYEATYMVSALKGSGTQDLLEDLATRMPEGPFLFDPEQISDVPMRFMAAEITREKIFDRLHQELPYGIMVETENWEEFENGSVKIDQIIYVQKENQKSIVLGKGGSRVKEIGQAAREDLEEMLARRVHVKIFVKVQENWAEKRENYRLIGLHNEPNR